MTKQCAWCLKIKINNTWVEGPGKKVSGTHGMCQECKEKCLREYEEYRKAA